MARLALILAFAIGCHHAKVISLAPLSRAANAHYLAAKLAMYREDYATAADELAAAAVAAPDQPMIVVEQARALVKADRIAAARDVLAKARGAWPDHGQVWLASGDVLEKISPDDAMRSYRRAIELERDDERGYLGLVRVELAREDTQGAERTLRSLVARIPGSVDGHYRLAQRLSVAGNQAGAVAELRAVLEHDPDHIDARLDLARTLRRLGKLDEAIVQTRGAFDRAAQPLDIAEELFWLLCESDDRQAAIDLLTLLDDDRSDAVALVTVARLDLGLGRLDEARPVIARIAALDPVAGTLALAELEAATSEMVDDPHGSVRIPAAVTTALTIPEDSPQFAFARRIAATALLAAHMPERALAVLEPARRARPDDLELAFAAAIALADAGTPADGRALLVHLQAKDPAEVALVRARFEDHLHDATAALALLDPIVRSHPHNVTALNLEGYLLADRKQRLDQAESMLSHARELQPGDPAILDSWGWLQLQKGRTRDAIRALDRASRFAPREPEILLHLATAWAGDHVPKTASELLVRAEALHPPPDVQRRIDDLRRALVIR